MEVKLMLKFFKSVGRFLERSERNFPKTFWLHTVLLASFLSYIGDIPRGGGNNSDMGSFIPPISTTKPSIIKGKNSGQSQDSKPEIGIRIASSMDGSGGSGGDNHSDDEITNQNVPPSDSWKNDPNYWKKYQPYSSQGKKNYQNNAT